MTGKRALRYTSRADMPPGLARAVDAHDARHAATVPRPHEPVGMATAAITGADPLPKGRGKGQHVRGEMNKGEQRYAAHLDQRKAAGEVLWWSFESVHFDLANRCRYTPDFFVMLAGAELELHEVKGRKGDRYWSEEDAKIKAKVAAEQFPLTFKIVWPGDGDTWCEEVL